MRTEEEELGGGGLRRTKEEEDLGGGGLRRRMRGRRKHLNVISVTVSVH